MAFTKIAAHEALETALMDYRQAAKKNYDDQNGWAQVPPDNMLAAIQFGRITALRDLLGMDG